MKKTFLVILIIVLLISLCGCSNTTTSNTTSNTEPTCKLPYHGIITWGSNGVYHVEIEDYIRISNGWIVVTTTDGKEYCTNEENVLIIKEKR